MLDVGKGMENALYLIVSTTSLWRSIWQYSSKLQMRVPFDPAFPLVGFYSPDKLMPEGSLGR
jgi:hypothetical protein